jgi:nitrite reductase (NO-forming)
MNKTMKKFLHIALAITLLLLLAGCNQRNTSEYKSDQDSLVQSGIFEFIEDEHDFGVIKQSGGVVSYDFPFTYKGDQPVSITSTPASCACTTADVSKKDLRPGDESVLTVRFNPNLHAEPEGRFFKTVTLITDPEFNNLPEIKVWAEIDLDLGEEFFELNLDSIKDDVSHSGKLTSFVKDYKKEFLLEAVELKSNVDENLEYSYWTYGETVPGPFLRARVGDELSVTLKNSDKNMFPHSIDLHAVNGPGGGGVDTQVFPGEQKTFKFKALNPGVYVYHCATPEVAEHVSNGMYGLIVIEPKDGFSKVDKEFYVVQGEIYSILARGESGSTQLSGEKLNAETPEYIVFNGSKGSLMGENALTARVGDKIRIFVGNGGVSKISNFHVIGEIFDTVYPEGGTPVQNNIQTTVVPAGGATIVEFSVDVPGTYKLVDHALSRLSKGAIAELVVSGNSDDEIYKPIN